MPYSMHFNMAHLDLDQTDCSGPVQPGVPTCCACTWLTLGWLPVQGVVLDCDHLEPEQLDRFPPATEAAAAHQQAKADGQVAGAFPLWLALDEVTDPVCTCCQRQRPVRLLN